MRKLEKLGTWGRSFLLLSILCFFAVYAQAQTVSGVVKDQNGDRCISGSVRAFMEHERRLPQLDPDYGGGSQG